MYKHKLTCTYARTHARTHTHMQAQSMPHWKKWSFEHWCQWELADCEMPSSELNLPWRIAQDDYHGANGLDISSSISISCLHSCGLDLVHARGRCVDTALRSAPQHTDNGRLAFENGPRDIEYCCLFFQQQNSNAVRDKGEDDNWWCAMDLHFGLRRLDRATDHASWQNYSTEFINQVWEPQHQQCWSSSLSNPLNDTSLKCTKLGWAVPAFPLGP